MDLSGIPKCAWRARLLETYRYVTGANDLPYNDIFFTLGGPANDENSELNYLLNRRFLNSHQYVSVEKNWRIHYKNINRSGPTWLYGSFEKQLQEFSNKNPYKGLGIISCDLMCSISLALPIIQQTLISCYNHSAIGRTRQTLLFFNILAASNRCQSVSRKLLPVWKTLQQDRTVRWAMRKGLTLVDRFQYSNKTVGYGSNLSTMETLSFAW